MKTATGTLITAREADSAERTRRLRALGYPMLTTGGTHAYLASKGIETEKVLKVGEGRPHIVDRLVSGDVGMVINNTFGKKEIAE